MNIFLSVLEKFEAHCVKSLWNNNFLSSILCGCRIDLISPAKTPGNAFSEFWGVLAILCEPTHESDHAKMALLCHGMCHLVLSGRDCNKMVALILCSNIWVWPCMVQSFLYWRQHTSHVRTSRVVLHLWLQDVCPHVDGPDGPRN